MTQNNGNGTQRAKLDPELNQEVRVRLLRDKPFTGTNSVGKYFLYSVVDLDSGEELAFFAPEDINAIIVDRGLGKGSEFTIKKVAGQNGKKNGSKLELSLVSAVAVNLKPTNDSDNLREILLQCVRDASDIVKEAGIQFSNDQLQKLATTLFIQRTRLV